MPHTGKTGHRPRRLDREQIKADVLRGLATGIPLSVIARRNGTSQQLVDWWSRRDASFAEAIAEARSLGWDTLASECLEIIDDKSNDVILDDQGVPHFNMAAVQRAKAQCEVRLRLLSRWDQGRYGEARLVRVEGDVQVTQRHVLDPSQLDDVHREALRALITHAQDQGLIEAQDAEFEEVLDPEEGA